MTEPGQRRPKEVLSPVTKEIYTEKYFMDQIKEKGYIPTGSTMLNLACSNNPFGGYSPGRYTNIIGYSHTGKTILALTTLATMAQDKMFQDYDLYYDDVEVANDFDIEYMFGKKFDKAVKMVNPPSHVIEDFFIKILKNIKKGKKFVDVTDSLDALTSEAEILRASNKKRTISNEGKKSTKEPGSYKTEKPREISEMLRVIKKAMKELGAHLIIISQTRQNIGFGAQFKPLVRSGGDALHFYCFHEIWLSQRGTEKKKNRIIGSEVEAKVQKNKITGKKRTVYFNVYDDFGIDDVGSMVDFLTDEDHWKKSENSTVKKPMFVAPEFDLEGTRAKLINYIECENNITQVKVICGKVWNEIEESIKLSDRKRRFE